MSTTRISDKYQVVIPKAIRQQLRLKEGQVLQIYVVNQGVWLSPVKKWPAGYIGSQKDLWKNVDVRPLVEAERKSWDRA